MTLSESLKILAFMLVLLVCLQCHVADEVQQGMAMKVLPNKLLFISKPQIRQLYIQIEILTD